MGMYKLWRKLIKETNRNLAPILALSKAILEGSVSMSKSLRPSMEFESEKENEENWVYVLFEFQYLLLHLVSRYSAIKVGPERRTSLLEEIGPLVIEPTIRTLFGHWPDDLRNNIQTEYYENLAKTEYEYGSCERVWSESDVDDMNDIVLYRFGKNVASVMGDSNSLGLIIDVQSTIVHGLKEIEFDKLLQNVYAVL